MARAFHTLAQYQSEHGDTLGCASVRNSLYEVLPLDRIDAPPELRENIDNQCETQQDQGEASQSER